MRISDWSSDVCSSDLSIWPSVALAVSYIAWASPFTSSGPRCLRIGAASSSSSSISRMAAADDPSIAGRVGAGSRASGTGALLHQLAHDERGALRILADEGADQIGARLIARRGLDHLQRDLAPGAAFADRRGRAGQIGRAHV